MKLLLLFVALLIGGAYYFIFVKNAPPPRKAETVQASESAAQKTQEEAHAKAEEDKAQAEAKAKAEAEEKAAAEAKAKAAELAAQEAKAKETAEAKAKRIAEVSAILRDLAQKNFEDAVVGADRDKAIALKKAKNEALDECTKARAVYAKAQAAARSSASSLDDRRSKSEYAGWRYVGSNDLQPMSRLKDRDRTRRIEYVAGNKSTGQDAERAKVKAALDDAKGDVDAAEKRRDAAVKAYESFAVECKTRLQKELAELKSR